MRHLSNGIKKISHQTDIESRSEIRSNHSAPRQSSCSSGSNIFQNPNLNSRASSRQAPHRSFNDQMKNTRKPSESKGSVQSSYTKPPLCHTNSAHLVKADRKVIHSTSLIDSEVEKRYKGTSRTENYENIVSIPKNNQNYLCNYCKNPMDELLRYQTSKCNEHYYCFVCITKRLSTNRSDFCSACLQYLNCVGVQPRENQMRCNLCPALPNQGFLKCKKHQYCRTCFSYINGNSCRHIFNLTSCQDCMTELLNKTSRIKPCETQANKHPTEAENLKIVPKSHSKEIEIFNIESKSHSEVGKNFIEAKITTKEAKIPEIQVKFDSNQTKTSEINIESHSKVVGSNLIPTSPKKISKPFTNPSLFKLSFDEIKSESSPESLQEICSPILSKSIDLSVSCTNCRGFNNIKGFLCNHNLCMFCVNLACLSEITKFFQQYQVDQNIIKNEFKYKCPVQNCNHPISVPTLMIMNNHLALLKEKNYKEATKIYSFITLDSVVPWVPYFDGLSSWCVFE